MKKYSFLKILSLAFIIILLNYNAVAQAPTVLSFSPGSGCAGTTPVVITGADFVNVSAVNFGGTPAQSFLVNSPTQITATPGLGATGTIAVTNPFGTGNSVAIFTVTPLPAVPTLVTATPNSICGGDSSNLNAISAGNFIFWYTTPTGGTAIGSSASGANFGVAPNVTTTYYAEAATAAIGTPDTFNYTGSIINYTIPPGITSVTINARGAQGGAGGTAPAGDGGLGANMTGTFTVTPGQILKILVGQQGGGSPNTPGAGGGGGSFVTDNLNNPLIVAGGGGGVHGTLVSVGKDAVTTNNGLNGYSTMAGYPNTYGVGGIGGNGATNGPANPHAGNGGGLLTDGAVAQCGGQGFAFVNGGTGGTSCTANIDIGGFGGGGGAGNNGAGGGGGYSGGGGSYHTPTNGGGAGSFNSGTNQNNLVNNTGHGLVIITPDITGCASPTRTPVTVTVHHDTISNITQSACVSYFFNGNNITTSGLYHDTLATAFGCDSFINLNLTINTVDINVTQAGSVLTAAAAGATYQWINCSNSMPVPGATAQTFTPAVSGSYAVIVTQNGCTDTSLCKTVVISGIEDYTSNNFISIYPNPIGEQLFVDIDKSLQGKLLLVYDAAGRLILSHKLKQTKNAIPVQGLSKGMYMISIQGIQKKWLISK